MDDKNSAVTAPDNRRYACFATPIIDPMLVGIPGRGGYKAYIDPGADDAPAEAKGDAEMDYLLGIDPKVDRALINLKDGELEALSRFLPSLLCGEESAVVIFLHESKRYDRKAKAAIRDSMLNLSREEEAHEIILNRLASWLPVPDDLDDIHRRATSFFIGLGFASASPEERLAQISALDTCVSLTLGAIGKHSDLKRSVPFLRIVDRIRRDEARHVKICRAHLKELDVTKKEQDDAGFVVRTRFIELLTPVADSFEGMGIDPDTLFGIIRRRKVL